MTRSCVKRTGILLALTAVGGFVSGCAENLNPPTDTGTGSLKLYVTDKPYPVDLLEYALVTVVRVDVRRADEDDDGGAVGCSEDAECDDGVACNGAESCDSGTCVEGAALNCADGDVCDEVRGGCADPCAVDADCADDLYCNGDEVCDPDTGQCFAGNAVACDESESCDDDADACVADEVDDDEDSDAGSPFVTIFEGSRELDLLELQNGRTDLLADTEVPAGTYTQMRVYVTEGSVKVVDVEEPFVMKVPSGAQSGIKLNFTFEVADGEDTELLLDVDLSRAFKVIPGGRIDTPEDIREFKFQPSLAMRLIDLLEAGSVAGLVVTPGDPDDDPVAGALVTLYDADDEEVTSSVSEEDGSFLLMGLPTGSYRLEVEAAGFDPAESPDVNVTAGETTDVGAVTLTATP